MLAQWQSEPALPGLEDGKEVSEKDDLKIHELLIAVLKGDGNALGDKRQQGR